MRKSLIITLIASIATSITMVSCNKNVYDEEKHGELIHYYSAVDSVDQQHMWMLTQSKTLRYQVPSGSSYKQLRFYTADPLTDKTAEFVVLVLSLACTFLMAVVLQKTGQRIISMMRQQLFVKIENLSHAQLNAIPVGKLVTRVCNDTYFMVGGMSILAQA